MSKKSRIHKNLIPKAKIILDILIEAFEHFDGLSIFYSQETWCGQIKRKSGRDIKRRQLNYDFKGVEEMGILKRYRRHRKDAIRGYEFRSTRYYIDSTGWRMAAYFKIIPWAKAFKMMAAIKKGSQIKLNRFKEWVTPAWMVELKDQHQELNKVPDG